MQQQLENLLYRIAAEIKNEAQREAPYRTGNLRNDIQVFDDKISQGEVRIGNTRLAPYAPYVHTGTGIHGPKGVRITPKKKKALKTPWGPRKSIAGMKPNPYMKRSYDKYRSGGGLQRALNESGLPKEILAGIKKSLGKNPNVRFL